MNEYINLKCHNHPERWGEILIKKSSTVLCSQCFREYKRKINLVPEEKNITLPLQNRGLFKTSSIVKPRGGAKFFWENWKDFSKAPRKSLAVKKFVQNFWIFCMEGKNLGVLKTSDGSRCDLLQLGDKILGWKRLSDSSYTILFLFDKDFQIVEMYGWNENFDPYSLTLYDERFNKKLEAIKK